MLLQATPWQRLLQLAHAALQVRPGSQSLELAQSDSQFGYQQLDDELLLLPLLLPEPHAGSHSAAATSKMRTRFMRRPPG